MNKTYDNGVMRDMTEEEIAETEALKQSVNAGQPPTQRLLTKLAFRNRFTAQEKAAIEIASQHDNSLPNHKTAPANLLAASLRANLADQRDARYVDLDRADTRSGVISLETFGILAAGRAQQILDAEISVEERFTG